MFTEYLFLNRFIVYHLLVLSFCFLVFFFSYSLHSPCPCFLISCFRDIFMTLPSISWIGHLRHHNTALHLDAPLPTSPQLTTPRTQSGSRGVDLAGDVPSAPTGVVAAIVSTRFVTLSWQMPEDTGSSEILAYSVYWRETGSDR